MQKAHLFEAAFRFNQGVDEAVSGLKRLEKSQFLSEDAYELGAAEIELRRATVNVQFFTDLSTLEKAAVEVLDERYGELVDEPLDHDKICRLMRYVEQQRKEEGKPPMAVFTEAAPPLEKPPIEKSEEPAPTAVN